MNKGEGAQPSHQIKDDEEETGRLLQAVVGVGSVVLEATGLAAV